jgi:hypothetical protein
MWNNFMISSSEIAGVWHHFSKGPTTDEKVRLTFCPFRSILFLRGAVIEPAVVLKNYEKNNRYIFFSRPRKAPL